MLNHIEQVSYFWKEVEWTILNRVPMYHKKWTFYFHLQRKKLLSIVTKLGKNVGLQCCSQFVIWQICIVLYVLCRKRQSSQSGNALTSVSLRTHWSTGFSTSILVSVQTTHVKHLLQNINTGHFLWEWLLWHELTPALNKSHFLHSFSYNDTGKE